jgi:hypothetical protein
MAFSRRNFLVGIGGAIVGLPFLEGLTSKTAHASNTIAPFAIFYRRGNGVQQGMLFGQAGREPERWWPQVPYGALGVIPDTSAISELAAYTSQMTIVRGLRHPMGTQLGHREGAVQGLTGAGVKYPGSTPDVFNCDSMGESLDNRICRELTPSNPESLYMSLGDNTGYTPGSAVSFRNTISNGKADTRTGEENLVALYNRIFLPGLSDVQAQQLLRNRRVSVNDLVRDQLAALQKDPRLSAADRDRLALHVQSIRDTETALTCTIPPALQGEVADYQSLYAASNGYRGAIAAEAGAMMAKLGALAVRCGAARAVLISMGPYQDGSEYDEVPGGAGENFHQVSHRLLSGNVASPNTVAMDLHHKIDRFHLQRFKAILDELAAVDTADGKTLLDHGVCVHYCDQGSGQHETTLLPYLYVGSAGGALKTGLYQNYATASGPGVQPGSDGEYAVKLLNTIGAAVGVQNAAKTGPLDDLNAANNGGIKGRLTALVGAGE